MTSQLLLAHVHKKTNQMSNHASIVMLINRISIRSILIGLTIGLLGWNDQNSDQEKTRV